LNTSLSEEIFERIKNDVIVGVLKQGAMLTEGELAKQIGASTTPVREALAQLHQIGMIERIPRKGYFITTITIKDIQEIIEFRLILEHSAAKLAVERITDEQLEALEQYRKIEMEDIDLLSIAKGILANKEFHVAIARATRNNHLIRAVEHILDETARLQYMDYSERGGIEAWPTDHGQIIDALKARDKEELIVVVENGLMETRDRLLRFSL